MKDNRSEPTNSEFHNAAVNPDMTPEEQAVVDEYAAMFEAEVMAIFHRVKAEVEAERAQAE